MISSGYLFVKIFSCVKNLLGRFNQTSPLHELFDHLSVMVVDEEAVFLVQQGYGCHVIRIQLEVENIQVLGHTFLPDAFRNDDDTALYQPPQGYLSHRLIVFFADSGKRGIVEKIVFSLLLMSDKID